MLSDTLPAFIENPDSGTVPTWSRLPITAIAKADLHTFTRGNGVDRAEDDVERVERSVIDKQRLRSILSRHSECVNGSRFLQMRVHVLCVCHSVYAYGFDLSNGQDTGVIFDRFIFKITLNLYRSVSKEWKEQS